MAAAGLDDLPENAIHELISRLPTKDAVRTSVLSRSWRHRWKSTTDIDLSSITLAAAYTTLRHHWAPVRHIKFQIEEKGWPELVSLLAAIASRSTTSLRSIDISSLCTVRLSTVAHIFPRLTLIKLSACIMQKPHRTTIFPDLRTLDITDAIILDEELDTDITGDRSVLMYIPACPKLEKLTLVHNNSIVRSDLDAIGRDFPCLTHLKLGILFIVPSALATPIFPYLRTLHITHFYVYSTGLISLPMFIPSCPKLEKLTLEHYRDIDVDGGHIDIDTIPSYFPRLNHLELLNCRLNISPSALASLRVLHLSSVYVHGKLPVTFSLLETLILKHVNLVTEDHLHVSAPNLRSLELVRVTPDGCLLRDFSIANSPVLETVLLDLVVDGGSDEEANESCNLMKVLGGLPRVKKLTLHGETIEFLRGGLIPQKLPTSFELLTHLSMDVYFSHICDTSVFCLLITSAPNLQELHLKWQYRYRGKCFAVGGNFWKEREHMDAFDNLKTVRMTLICKEDYELELEIIQFVLSKARVLETMVIEFETLMIEFLYDTTHMESFMKKVLEFPKVSLQAQIVFPIHREHVYDLAGLYESCTTSLAGSYGVSI